jgi:peptidoglycan/xylan/chitin deacetylase (PgdA/CDA1 family)
LTTWTAARIAKLGISCVVGILDWVSSVALSVLRIEPRSRCVVLYYHEVTAQSRRQFAQQLDDLLKYTQPMRLDRSEPLQRGKRYSAVTFDDGFCSVIENALPELTNRAIPSTHFIVAGALGHKPEWVIRTNDSATAHERVMSSEQLRGLAELVTIGSHTLTHPFLPAVSEAEARRQIGESRSILRSLTNTDVNVFSFPYGAFNSELVKWCAEAGYTRVFTTQPVYAFAEDQEFVSGRVPVSPDDSRLEFRLKLLGAYRWMPWAVALKQQLLRWP